MSGAKGMKIISTNLTDSKYTSHTLNVIFKENVINRSVSADLYSLLLVNVTENYVMHLSELGPHHFLQDCKCGQRSLGSDSAFGFFLSKVDTSNRDPFSEGA